MSKNRRGAPLGNLNRAKNIVPALKRVQQGRPLPQYLERIVSLADREANKPVADKGGLENMSGAEKLMVNIWKSSRQAELLIWHELIQRGAVRSDESGNWDLQAGFQRLAPFLQAQHRALVSLGLERREKSLDLRTFLDREGNGKW